MTKYAGDLVAYWAEIGEASPTKVLEDPALLKRALSTESPIGLVGAVAKNLEGGVDANPVIAGLSDYERGRVMSALGRQKDAEALYRRALQGCEDQTTRGLIMRNLSNEVDDQTEQEALLRDAIETGCTEAYSNLGSLLKDTGRMEEAVEVLLEGVKKGVGPCLVHLGVIYRETKSEQDFIAACNDLMRIATEAGIQDPANAPFDELSVHTVLRAPQGVTAPVTNMLSLDRTARAGVAEVMGV